MRCGRADIPVRRQNSDPKPAKTQVFLVGSGLRKRAWQQPTMPTVPGSECETEWRKPTDRHTAPTTRLTTPCAPCTAAHRALSGLSSSPALRLSLWLFSLRISTTFASAVFLPIEAAFQLVRRRPRVTPHLNVPVHRRICSLHHSLVLFHSSALLFTCLHLHDFRTLGFSFISLFIYTDSYVEVLCDDIFFIK